MMLDAFRLVDSHVPFTRMGVPRAIVTFLINALVLLVIVVLAQPG